MRLKSDLLQPNDGYITLTDRWRAMLKLTWWVGGTNPSTLERVQVAEVCMKLPKFIECIIRVAREQVSLSTHPSTLELTTCPISGRGTLSLEAMQGPRSASVGSTDYI